MNVLLISGHVPGYNKHKDGLRNEGDLNIEAVKLLKQQLEQYEDVNAYVYPIERNAFDDCNNGVFEKVLKENFTGVNFHYVYEKHFNATNGEFNLDGKKKGFEIFVTSLEKSIRVEQNIAKKFSKYFPLRDDHSPKDGVKVKNLKVIYTVKKMGISSALVETCFYDDEDDMKIYEANKVNIARDEAEGMAEIFGWKKKTVQTGITILGTSVKDAVSLQIALKKKNPTLLPRYINIAAKYIEIAKLYGVRGDIAFCQAMHETGWFKFNGDVKEGQNNFAGLGAVGGGAKGATFNTIDEGIHAHIQHLFAYASKAALPNGVKKVDPRFDLVNRGCAKYWTDLNGKWAVPGATYGQKIIELFDSIVAETPKPVEPPKPAEKPKPVEPPKPTVKTYKLVVNCRTYTNAANAKKRNKPVGTYGPGTYYVYKESDGMINVSRTPGSPGGWINPKDNAKVPTVAYYPKYKGSTVSIVTALNSLKIDSSYTNRAKIAKANGIKLYVGTSSQNTKMLNLLKTGKLKKV